MIFDDQSGMMKSKTPRSPGKQQTRLRVAPQIPGVRKRTSEFPGSDGASTYASAQHLRWVRIGCVDVAVAKNRRVSNAIGSLGALGEQERSVLSQARRTRETTTRISKVLYNHAAERFTAKPLPQGVVFTGCSSSKFSRAHVFRHTTHDHVISM